jgi:hypothetical protein
LQKNCKDRPSIQQILENEKLIEWATELNHVVPTEEEVNDLINGQRTDFMTTFMKKKSNKDSSVGAGSVGLVSRDKLKNKHYSPIVKTSHVAKPGTKLSPSEPIKKKNISIDINEISDDAIKAIDKLSGEKSGNKKKALVPDYSKKPFSAKKSARKLTPNLDDKDNHASNPKKVTGSKAAPKASLNVDASDKGPHSSQKQKRDIMKPWRRPKTARVKAEEIKKTSKDEHIDNKKEGTRKKASDIVDSRRKQIRPVFTKPADYKHGEVKEEKKKSENVSVKKAKTDEQPQKPHKADQINIGLLEDEVLENPKELPLPYVQMTSKSFNPKQAMQMKKTKSAVIGSLLIPLNQIEEDFSQRNLKEGDMNPVVAKDSSKNESSTMKKGGNASKMIGDIKKKMKYKGAKSLETNEYIETTEIQVINGANDILTSGHVDEVENIKHTYVTNEEEDKLDKYNLSYMSKTSLSTNEIPIMDDGEGEGEYDFFDYNDKNFFEDYDLTKTPFLDFGLDQIDENDELDNDDDDEEENHLASLKRRIKDLTQQRNEKWRDLRTSSEYEKCKK